MRKFRLNTQRKWFSGDCSNEEIEKNRIESKIIDAEDYFIVRNQYASQNIVQFLDSNDEIILEKDISGDIYFSMDESLENQWHTIEHHVCKCEHNCRVPKY